jgi:hypothetical protein
MVKHGVPDQVCKMLGLATLWRCFSTAGEDCFPETICRRVLDGIQELGATYTLPKDGTNPVRKIPLLVTGSDSEVIIDMLDDELVGGEGEGGIEEYRRQLRLKDQQVRLLTNKVPHLRRQVASAQSDQDRQFSLLHNICFGWVTMLLVLQTGRLSGARLKLPRLPFRQQEMPSKM